MIAKGKINDIEITAGAINFDFIGGSIGSSEGSNNLWCSTCNR